MIRIIRIFASFIYLLTASLPASAQEVDLSGIWQVSGFTKAYGNLDFLVRIERFGLNGWNAAKLSSSQYVPSGKQHFQGTVSGTTMQASVQVAFPGFGAPAWERHQFRLERDSQGKVTGIVLLGYAVDARAY